MGLGLSPVRSFRQPSGGGGRNRVNVRDVHLLAIVVTVVVVAVVVDVPPLLPTSVAPTSRSRSAPDAPLPGTGLQRRAAVVGLAEDAVRPGSR